MESVACCAAGFLPGQPPLWVIFGLSRLGALGSLCPECPNSGHQSLGSIRPSQSARQSIGTGCRPFRTRASGRSTRRFWRRQAKPPPQKIEGDNRREVGRPLDVLGTSPLWACAGQGQRLSLVAQPESQGTWRAGRGISVTFSQLSGITVADRHRCHYNGAGLRDPIARHVCGNAAHSDGEGKDEKIALTHLGALLPLFQPRARCKWGGMRSPAANVAATVILTAAQ